MTSWHQSVEHFDNYVTRNLNQKFVGVSNCTRSVVFLAKLKIKCPIFRAFKQCLLGFDDVVLEYVEGDVGSKMFSTDFIPDKDVFLDRPGGSAMQHAPEVYKKYGWSVGSSVFTDMEVMANVSWEEFAYWAPKIESMEFNSESNLWKGRKQRGCSWVESDLCGLLEEGRFVKASGPFIIRVYKDCIEKNLEDDASEFVGVHSQ
ncbi:hypothetical protein Tco_1402693 [Tanacetum coccineum]